MRARWEHFSHGTDIGIRGIGRTLEEAFEQGAVALCETALTHKHEPAVEVKGASFTELEVVQRPDGTGLAQCVVDV